MRISSVVLLSLHALTALAFSLTRRDTDPSEGLIKRAKTSSTTSKKSTTTLHSSTTTKKSSTTTTTTAKKSSTTAKTSTTSSKTTTSTVSVPFQTGCTNPSKRVNFKTFTKEQQTAYFSSIECLQKAPAQLHDAKKAGAISRYDDLVWIHVSHGNFGAYNDTWHVVGQFLHQHRLYVHALEVLLREECGYTGNMAYWDETEDSNSFNTSTVIAAHGGCGGSYGPHYVTTGPFAGLQAWWGPPINSNIPNLSEWPSEVTVASPLWRFCVNYWGEWANMTSVRSVWSNPTFAAMKDQLFLGIHSAGHFGIGGQMGNGQASPSDPMFWMHHTYLDGRWAQWQNMDPSTRTYEIAPLQPIKELGTELMTLDTILYTSYLLPNVRVRDVANTTGGYLCYVYEGLST